jgi:hypothetical protein
MYPPVLTVQPVVFNPSLGLKNIIEYICGRNILATTIAKFRKYKKKIQGIRNHSTVRLFRYEWFLYADSEMMGLLLVSSHCRHISGAGARKHAQKIQQRANVPVGKSLSIDQPAPRPLAKRRSPEAGMLMPKWRGWLTVKMSLPE